jgi:hypothetical protein
VKVKRGQHTEKVSWYLKAKEAKYGREKWGGETMRKDGGERQWGGTARKNSFGVRKSKVSKYPEMQTCSRWCQGPVPTIPKLKGCPRSAIM